MSWLGGKGCRRASTRDITSTYPAGDWILRFSVPAIHTLTQRACGSSGIAALTSIPQSIPAVSHCRTETLTICTGFFLFCFAFSFFFFFKELIQPFITSIFNSYLLVHMCIYTDGTSDGAKFPLRYLSSLLMNLSHVIGMPIDTRYRGQLEPPSPSPWWGPGPSWPPWAPPATPAWLAVESQAPNFQLLHSPALGTWSIHKTNRGGREESSHTAPSWAQTGAHPK